MNRPSRHIRALLAFLMVIGSACSAPPKDTGVLPPVLQSTANRSHLEFPTPTVLSIFPFEDRARRPELAWLSTGLADMLVAELADNPMLIVVQRERVEEIVREQALQLSGRVADASTVKIGRLIGANVLVIGRMVVNSGTLRLDAQLVGVEHGAVLGAAAAEGSVQEVVKVAHLLVAKLRALLPGSAADVSPMAPNGVDLLGMLKANHAGEELSREGKLFEALAEFERALRLNPNNTLVQNHVARTLTQLPPRTWLKPDHTEPDQQALNRTVERLAMAFEMDIGRHSLENTQTGRAVLRIATHIQMSQPVLDDVLSAFAQVPGVVLQRSEQDNTASIRFGSRPDLIEALAHDGSLSRRLYLRLLSQEGRTIAVYSGFREWTLSNWISVADSTLRIKRAHVLDSEAIFVDMTEEQVAAIASMRVTIDRVPHERAKLRLDIQPVTDLAGDKESARMSPESRSDRHTRLTRQDAAISDSMSPLRILMEAAWFPSVTARPWSRGYVPSNERTAVVTLTLDRTKRSVSVEPRLSRSSGETDFDQAALAAARTGLQQWLATEGYQSLLHVHREASIESGALAGLPSLKVRVQFQLHKDVPALNLIGPRPFDHHDQPLSFSSSFN